MTARPTPAAAMLADILAAGLDPEARADIEVTGAGDLDSAFAVTDLAAASIGAAGVAASALATAADGRARAVEVDRRLASAWFGFTLRPHGWDLPSPWDPIAGDYEANDGWIRLHTNAPAHRAAALDVLGVPAEPDRVRAAVAAWQAGALETAVLDAGGCAAAMHSEAVWNASAPGQAVRAEPLIHWDIEDGAPPTSPPADPARPLAGLRVLDLTRVLAGPVATRFLALLGADVLRIDPPDWDEPGVTPEVMLGKRTARLDLRREDRATFETLLASADLLVHGYRPGALDGLGLGLDARRQLRPDLIEVTLDAYGWTGPWRGRRGFDSLVQMSAGIAHTGMGRFGSERPRPLPVQALDHATGYLMAFAALQSLSARLAGRIARARLSLARTAALLTAYPLASPAPLAPLTPEDLAPAVEATGWGPARRLNSPLTIEDAPVHTDRPAMPLGSHSGAW
ncbi:MAG: CoA transferase [Dehalococcoidia bacterium]|nr:CoA transferase [Dehalococcoidia bacterium]